MKTTMNNLFVLALILVSLACSKNQTKQTNYYFDANGGNDSNSGISEKKAFKSLNKIQDLTLKPGDSILLKSGVIFEEQLFISCKGDSARPVVIDKYGGTAKPYIKGDASEFQAVYILNSEYIHVNNLEISNKGEKPVSGLYGIKVELRNYGTACYVVLDNLFVHDVYGNLIKTDNEGGGAGIMIMNYRKEKPDSIPSRFDGLLVQNCLVQDCQRNGIMMMGNWIRKKWYPNLNVLIRNNIIEGVPGDGIVPVACESPVVEYNVMKNCPATLPASEACDGIWPWSCNNALIQYNIVSDHHSQVDGYGFDSDWNSINSVFQYNLSFNNDGGFLLVCNSGNWPLDWSIGNVGTIARYNISINDGLRDYIVENRDHYFSPVIHVTGPVKNTLIEKNLIYILKKKKPEIDKTILDFSNWKGYADSTFFQDNYIFVEEENTALKVEKSTNNFFKNNQYIGELKNNKEGFEKYGGKFDKEFWYNKNDENWDKLVDFVSDKNVIIDGKEIPVLKIIGFQ